MCRVTQIGDDVHDGSEDKMALAHSSSQCRLAFVIQTIQPRKKRLVDTRRENNRRKQATTTTGLLGAAVPKRYQDEMMMIKRRERELIGV